MKIGPKEYMEHESNYVVTESSIPVEALELFEVNDIFIKKMMYVVVSGKEKTSGITHKYCLRVKKNEYIKKEIAEFRKVLNITNIYTRRYIDIDEDIFPLGAILV